MFFPWFIRQDIREGNYIEAHRTMKCYAAIWSVFALIAIIRIKDYIFVDSTKWTADIYLTEIVYFQISQSSFLILCLNCIFSYLRCYLNPKVLLRGNWQKFNRNKMLFFIGIWVFVLLNSFLLWLWNYLTKAVDPIKTIKPPVSEEDRSNYNSGMFSNNDQHQSYNPDAPRSKQNGVF